MNYFGAVPRDPTVTTKDVLEQQIQNVLRQAVPTPTPTRTAALWTPTAELKPTVKTIPLQIAGNGAPLSHQGILPGEPRPDLQVQLPLPIAPMPGREQVAPAAAAATAEKKKPWGLIVGGVLAIGASWMLLKKKGRK